jgi:hypothetical protein
MEDGSLEKAVPCLLERRNDGSLLVDPFAFDLRSLRAAEAAGLHSVSLIASPGISRHIGQASGFSVKVEIPPLRWLPAFLLQLWQLGEVQEAANKSRVSPARVYQAMKREKSFRLAVNAIRTGRGG